MRRTPLLAPLRDLFAGRRLILSIVVGAAALVLASAAFGPLLRLTLAWIVGVAAFLGLTLLAMMDSTPARVRLRARQLDERSWVISVLIIAGAAASLGALGFVLQKPAGGTATVIVLACLAIVESWLLAHTTFAMHYAHSYYGDADESGEMPRGGLAFPGDDVPDYWDFLYYSFVVGMTCQVSDVQVTSRAMRRLTLAHGVISFFFNTGVLALAINVLASAL